MCSLLLLTDECNTKTKAVSKDAPVTNTNKKGQSTVLLQTGPMQQKFCRDPTALPGRQGLTFGIDSGDALGGADIPDADGFVPRCRDKEVRVAGVPAELIHTVTMAPVIILLHLEGENSRSQEG